MKWGLIILGVLVLLGLLTTIFGGGDESDTSNPTTGSTSTLPTQSEASAPEGYSAPAEAAALAEENAADVPADYNSALRNAEMYVDTLPFSYQGLYDQLTSEYGGQFTPEAAQYAMDNVEADWNQEAVEAAKGYQETMAMSPAAIYDQLVSEFGGKFTAEEAQFGVDNLG